MKTDGRREEGEATRIIEGGIEFRIAKLAAAAAAAAAAAVVDSSLVNSSLLVASSKQSFERAVPRVVIMAASPLFSSRKGERRAGEV